MSSVAQPTQRELAARLYREGDLSVEQIAERVGVSRATIYNWLSAEGLSGTRRGITSGPPTPPEGLDVTAVTVANTQTTLLALANDIAELCRLREVNTNQTESIKSDVNEMRRDVADLRAEVARLVGAVEALTTIQRGPHGHED